MDDWWKRLPCHLCSEWDLKGEINLDVRKLKQRVEWDLEDEPDFMPIENLLYRAFLEVPPDSYLMKGRSSPETALKLLKDAEDKVLEIWKNKKDVQNSYKLVINAFRMWLYNDGNFKESSKIDELNETLKELSNAVAANPTPHVNIVLATALTRLGLDRYQEGIELFQKALNDTRYAENVHWQFSKALLIGRKARSENKNARGTMSDGELFEMERSIFGELIAKDPQFAWARAYLGKCLYNLKRHDEGLEQLRQAHEESPNNRDIAIIYGRVLRWNERFSESETVLKSIKNGDQSEEVSFQLGLIHNKLARNESLPEMEREAHFSEAFKFVNQAVHLDKNHVPALCTRAELAVELGKNEEAKNMFLDLFRGKDMSPEQLFYLRCRVNERPNLFNIFQPNERLDNAYKILLLCTENFVEPSNSIDAKKGHKEFTKSFRDGTNEAFAVIDMEINKQSALKLDAMRLLSDIMFRLSNYRRAEILLTKLRAEEERSKYQPEILWRLGKCLCALGNDVAAENVAKLLPTTQTENNNPRELFADIYLMRAKSTMGPHSWSLLSEDQRSNVIANLRLAIEHGSIEACYVFLTNVMDLAQQVCRENGTAKIIAEIKRCLKRKDSVHHTFHIEGQSAADKPVTAVVDDLMANILTYPKHLDGLPHLLKTRYESMTSIRFNLIDFEYTFNYICEGQWDSQCQEKAEKTLTDARNLLDHTIYSYQRAVLDKKPVSTNFPIHNKDAKNKPVEDKLDGYLQKYFHKAEPPVPQHIKDYIVSLQPMSHPDNNWLNALSSFVNDAKHTGSDYGDTVRVEGKLGETSAYKKEDLVRISCCRVEAIAATLLEFVQDLYDNQKTKPDFLLEHERELK